MPYPKPKGWNGGPDGHIQRQGSGGHIGWNPNTDRGEQNSQMNRRGTLDFEEADFGGLYGGTDTDVFNDDLTEGM